MSQGGEQRPEIEKAADIIRDAGGKIVGRTRLQKIAYLLEITGLGDGFAFEYRHFGPYSESLANAMTKAQLLDLIEEKEMPTSWGGFYSIFTTPGSGKRAAVPARLELIKAASNADPIELELAATAALLAVERSADPWGETAKRKPDKAPHLQNAKLLYRKLLTVTTPRQLPKIA
jgi:hypothetical protein